MARLVAALICPTIVMCLIVAAPFHASGEEKNQLADTTGTELQKHFAEAYNRGDVDAMAAAFAENAIRVTPSGIFQGREAIRHNLQDAVNMGLHDYSVRQTISRSEGDLVFNAGEWQAKLGDRPFHGYYSSILGRAGDHAEIVEETVTIAAP